MDKVPEGNLYSLILISKEDWYCERCTHLLKQQNPTNIICTFCPELKGIMKKIKNSKPEIWAHVSCVNWIPEIYYDRKK